ncbi:MAG: pyrroline-5-carboxylate reductase [Lachnospiraceae bacterium]|jgi:pyrroline-5-carboxylate reductase
MKVGFIGCGNMATAMIKGMIQKGILDPDHIWAADVSKEFIELKAKELGIHAAENNVELAKQCGIIVLSVKPQYYETVIRQIRDVISQDQVVITIAPGKTLTWLGEQFGKEVKIVRTMPNTPALVGEGITGVCKNEWVSDAELEQVLGILRSFGKAEVVGENLMDVVVSVSGSSPAYVFMLIEAMADGAVADGMPRAQAYEFAAQAVMGSAKMVLETGKHPGELKDMVCSPGGTTMEAVRVLEEKGFRSSVIECMKACVKKARGL